MYVEPQAPRFTLEATVDGQCVVVPARRNWFVPLFLCAWLVGWAFGEVSAVRQLLSLSENIPRLFLLAWLAAWTLGGAFALGAVLWQLAGREILSVTPSALVHRIEAFGLGWSWRYKIAEVRNLRATEYTSNPFTHQATWFPPITGSGFGPVAFDYGSRTLRFGASLEEAEAKLLVEKLAIILPRRLNEG